MALIPIRYRMFATPTYDKAAIEDLYGQIVKVVGGTYYTLGVPTGPVNGSLDWRNFSLSAGISIRNRTEKYSLCCLNVGDQTASFDWAVNGAYQTDFPIPWHPTWSSSASLLPTIVGWSFCMSGTWTSINGSITVRIARGGTTVAIGTQAQPAYTAGTTWVNTTGLSIPIYPGDKIQTLFTKTAHAGPTPLIYSAANCIWIKSPHVR